MEQINHEAGESRVLVPMTEPDRAALDIIRTETVLSRLPIHNLAKKGRVDIQILKTTPDGQVELKWEVSPNPKFGDPRALAYKLDTIIIQGVLVSSDRTVPRTSVTVFLASSFA